MRSSPGLNPVRMSITLVLGLAVGAVTFKVVLGSNLPKNFPMNRAIAATGIAYVIVDSIWASRQAKKEELEYRKDLQTSLKMLEDSQKKDK